MYKAIPEHVSLLFQHNGNSTLVYHNLEHTKLVVSRVIEIAESYDLHEMESFVLFVAAWFHDAGQLFTVPQDHEKRSVSIMEEFMLGHGVSTEIIDLIRGCIMATKIPHRPETFLQEIICDADTYNLGTNEFTETDDLLREELSLRGFATGKGWDESTLAFLSCHRFFTSYCQQNLQNGKQRNIDIINRRIKNS